MAKNTDSTFGTLKKISDAERTDTSQLTGRREQLIADLEQARLLTERNTLQDTAVGIADTLQSIAAIGLAPLPGHELADAARRSEALNEYRSPAFMLERARDAQAVADVTAQEGEWAGLIESAKRAVTGGNTVADVMAQSPYLLIGPTARALGFAAANAVPGVVGRGLAAVAGTSEGAIINRVAALSGILEGTGSYGQTYEQVLRNGGTAEEATRQANIAGASALAAGLLLGKLTPGFEMDPTGLRGTSKITSQFIGQAIKPTLSSVAGEVFEESGMAVTNTVTDNVMNGRDPLEGVGGAVGEAAAISGMFAGGMRSPGLVRDTSKAVGLGVLKGLQGIGGAVADRAITPEGEATRVAAEQARANAAEAAAAFDASLGTVNRGGDPASTEAGTDTATRTSAHMDEEGFNQYQLQLGERTAPEPKAQPTNADRVLIQTALELQAARTDEAGTPTAEAAAAAEQAVQHAAAGRVEEAEKEIAALAPEAVKEAVDKASRGDAEAQATVEAIGAIDMTALPNEALPANVVDTVGELRALPQQETTDLSEKAQETRRQILEEGWSNRSTGKANARRRGMRSLVQGVLQGLVAANIKDTADVKNLRVAVEAASFLLHLQQRATEFQEARKLALEVRKPENKDNPLYKEYNDQNYVPVENSATLDEEGKRTTEPFKMWINAKNAKKSINFADEVQADTDAAQAMWDIIAKNHPQLAKAAMERAKAERAKLDAIIEMRARAKAQQDLKEGLKKSQEQQRAEKFESNVMAAIDGAQNQKRLSTVWRSMNKNADRLSPEARQRIRQAFDAKQQKLIKDAIDKAKTPKQLKRINKEIKKLGDEVSEEVKAGLRDAYQAKLDALTPPQQPAAPATPAPTAAASAVETPVAVADTPAPTGKPKLTNIVLRIAKAREYIKTMLPDIRWEQVGGKGIVDGAGKVSRTTWLAHPTIAPWWSRDLGLSMEKTQQLFAKLASGKYNPKQLGANQKQVIEAYLDWLESNLDKQANIEAQTRAAEETARQQEEEARAEARAEREAIQSVEQEAEARLAREDADAQPGDIPADGTATDTDQGSVATNPLTKVVKWARGNLSQWFTVSENNTVDQWKQKMKDIQVRLPDGTLTTALDLYGREVGEIRTLLMGDPEKGTLGIFKAGIFGLNAANKQEWLEKTYGVGSILWEEVSPGVYEVPAEVAEAFALAGVTVMMNNTAKFRGVFTEEGTLSREVQKEAWAADIAQIAMKMLGVKANNDTSITIAQGTFLAYGLSTVAALIENKNFEMREGFVEGDTKDGEWSNANLRTEEVATAEEVEAGISKRQQILVPEPQAFEAVKTLRNVINQVQTLFEQEQLWEAQTEPHTTVDKKVQYSNIDLSTEQQKSLENLQQVQHKLFPAMHNAMQALGLDGMEQLLTGWWSGTAENAPPSIQKWLKAQHIRLQHEWSTIQHYLELTENGAKPLFYKYHIGLNGRPKTIEGPQNNKMLRDLFSSGEAMIDLNVPEQRDAVLLAIAQAYGIKTDINDAQDVLKEWEKKRTEVYPVALKVLEARNEDGTFNPTKLKAALKRNKPYTEREFAALLTYAEMLRNPTNSALTTHLMFEIDGKTNGAFNAEMFFGLAAHSDTNLEQGGFFRGKHGATWATEKARIEARDGTIDFYTRLNIAAKKQLGKVLENLAPKDRRFVRGYLELLEAAKLVEVDWSQQTEGMVHPPIEAITFKRDLAKFAIIPIQYGAGIAGIKSQMWADVVTKMNENWIETNNKLQALPNTPENKEARRQLTVELMQLQSRMAGWDTFKTHPMKMKDGDSRKNDAWRWHRALSMVSGAMHSAYAEEKPVVKAMTDLLVQLTNFAYQIKKVQWETKKARWIANNATNQQLAAKYGKSSLYELSEAEYRELMGETLDISFSVLDAPKAVSLNKTQWVKSSHTQVRGIGTSIDAYLNVPEPAEVGVSGLALLTIGGGDAAMGTRFFQERRQVTHVFDGMDLNPLERIAMGTALNEAVWATAGFDILQDFHDLIWRMDRLVEKSEFTPEMQAMVVKIFNDTAPAGTEKLETFEQWQAAYTLSVIKFQEAYDNQRKGWAALQTEPNTVNQMGGGGTYDTPVRSSAALEDDLQLSLEESAPRQEVTDLSETGTREEGLYKDRHKDPDATRIEDSEGMIDVIMKGDRWRATDTFTNPNHVEKYLDGMSAGLRRLVKVLTIAARAGVAFDSDQSVSPAAIRMYLRAKRAGIITYDSPFTDKQLEEAAANNQTLRTTDATRYTGPSVFSNVRLVGKDSIGLLKPNADIQTAFDVNENELNQAGVIAALDNVKWRSPIYRMVWKRLRNVLPLSLKVKLATTEEQWNEAARPLGVRRAFNSVSAFAVGNNVVLRTSSAEVMLHELIHTIFTKHIDNFFTNINLVPVELRGPINDLVQLMNKFKRLPAVGRVGFVQRVMRSYEFRGQPQDELGEMLAYVFTEEGVIEELSPGFTTRVFNRVKQILSYVTGIPLKMSGFYSEAMDVFRSLTDNVPQDANLASWITDHISEHVAGDNFTTLQALTTEAFHQLITRDTPTGHIKLRDLKKDTDAVLAMATTAYSLSPQQDMMFRRLYALFRHSTRNPELDRFVNTTLPQHAQKNLFNKAPDVVAATMALAGVEPTFAGQLDTLWNAREQESRVDRLVDMALNEAQQASSREMINDALAAMFLEQEEQSSYLGTAVSRLDRLGRSILNKLGAKADELSATAPNYVDDGLFIVGALLNEKNAAAFGESVISFVNTKMSQQSVRDVVAAVMGTKGSGKLIYRAHNAMITLINQTRSIFDNTLPRELAKLFPKNFDGWTWLYDHFGQLDVATLGSSTEEMFRNDAERQRMIRVLQSKLDNWIDAENLGYFLAHRTIKPGSSQNLLRNARAIAENLNGQPRKASDALVADADQLVTLYAIEALAASDRARIVSYFDAHRDSMNKLVGMLKHVKDTEQLHQDSRYRYTYWKTSLPMSVDPRRSTVIGNSIKGAQLLALGYTRGEKYQQTSGDPESDLYYYHRKYSPPPVFSQGIIATVQQTGMGINYTTAASVTPEVGTMLASPTAVAYINQHKGRDSQLIPIHNFEGKVVGYERLLNPAIVRKGLGAENTMLHVAIGKKLGRITEENLARQLNQEAIKIMHDQWVADEAAGRGNEYEAVNSTSDKQVARAWENVPGDIKAKLEDVFNGKVMVRRELIPNTLGYHSPTALEIFTGDASLDPQTRKMMLGLIQTTFFGNTQAFLKAELAVKEGVATAKDLIIVRSLTVALQNAMAALHLVIANGVPPAKVIKLYREGMREVQAYNRLQREAIQLRVQIAGTTNPVEQERLRALQRSKQASIKRLHIYPLIEAGELSDLPEGLEESPPHSYLGDLAGWMNNHLRRVHPKAPAVVANALFAKDSAIHDALSKSIQAGDFLARYAVYQHMVDKGISPETARNEVRDELISYQTNPGRLRAGLETYGMIWWSQFTLRAQAVLLNRFRKNPFSFFVSQGLGNVMGTPGPLDGALIERGFDTSTGLDNVFSAPTAMIHMKVF